MSTGLPIVVAVGVLVLPRPLAPLACPLPPGLSELPLFSSLDEPRNSTTDIEARPCRGTVPLAEPGAGYCRGHAREQTYRQWLRLSLFK